MIVAVSMEQVAATATMLRLPWRCMCAGTVLLTGCTYAWPLSPPPPPPLPCTCDRYLQDNAITEVPSGLFDYNTELEDCK